MRHLSHHALALVVLVAACGSLGDAGVDPDIPVVGSLSAQYLPDRSAIEFRWSEVGGVDGYLLRVWGPLDTPRDTGAVKNDLDYREYGVSTGDETAVVVADGPGTYYGSVRAYREEGDSTAYGALGNVVGEAIP